MELIGAKLNILKESSEEWKQIIFEALRDTS